MTVRITPAYAGKSFHDACQIILSQDHPRLCGEKHHSGIFVKRFLGSPPPMRGKAVTGVTAAVAGRITPAYAGKSKSANCECNWSKDHPRLCGEKFILHKHMICIQGSPPPMRGKACGRADI